MSSEPTVASPSPVIMSGRGYTVVIYGDGLTEVRIPSVNANGNPSEKLLVFAAPPIKESGAM